MLNPTLHSHPVRLVPGSMVHETNVNINPIKIILNSIVEVLQSHGDCFKGEKMVLKVEDIG